MLGWISSRVFLGARQRRLMNRAAPVFNYHKIGPAPKASLDPFLYTRAEEFDRHLKRLLGLGFSATNLDLLLSPNSVGRHFVVTFDDAFQNVMDHGLKILARHQVCAIQFVVADLIGKRNEWDIAKGDVAEPLMDVAQIREWLAAGHQIGSHTLTHRNLKRLTPTEAREEISSSKKKMEDLFGLEIRHFAYPFGGWNPPVRDLVIEAGYRSASTMIFGVNSSPTDPFALRRIIPYGNGELLRKMAHRLARKTRPRR